MRARGMCHYYLLSSTKYSKSVLSCWSYQVASFAFHGCMNTAPTTPWTDITVAFRDNYNALFQKTLSQQHTHIDFLSCMHSLDSILKYYYTSFPRMWSYWPYGKHIFSGCSLHNNSIFGAGYRSISLLCRCARNTHSKRTRTVHAT